jgi:uncharacterized protein with GYD domain
MSLYMSQFGYTAETWARLIEQPEDRRAAVSAIIEPHGAKLVDLWYAFGASDGFALLECADDRTAAAIAMAITSSGAFSSFVTTPLMTQAEALEAMQKAQEIRYVAPAQGVTA